MDLDTIHGLEELALGAALLLLPVPVSVHEKAASFWRQHPASFP